MADFIPMDEIPLSTLKPGADAGGRTGTYVSLKNALMAYVVFYITQGNAATVACDVLQASAVAGTGAKALTNNTQIFTNLDADTSSVYARQTDAKAYTTDAALKTKIVVIAIDPAQLDAANSFDCIAARTGASNAANITSAQIIVVPRFTGTVANQPNYLID